MPDIEKFDAKVLELCDENDIFMTLNLLLITSNPNLNLARFTPDFIHEVVKNKDFYISGIPLMAERNKLESGKKNLGHGLNKKGKLISDVIGAFSNFYEREAIDGSWELLGECKVFKRFPETCKAIETLYSEGNLSFSIEAMVSEYKYEKETGVREIDVGKGQIFGDACVSSPAEEKSKCLLLVSEALNIDLGCDNLEGKSVEEYFSTAKLKLEKSELDFQQVQCKIFNEMKNQLGEEMWNYNVMEISSNYVILFDGKNGDYFRMDYSINGDNLTLSEKYKVSKNYTKIEEVQEEMELKELEKSLAEALASVETLKTEITEKDTVIAEHVATIASKDAEIETITANVNVLSEDLIAKTAEIETLQASKTELDAINAEKTELEKATKKTELTEKYTKLLSAEVMATEEVMAAIEDLNEVVLQAKVVEKALAEVKVSETKPAMVTATRITDNLEINGNDVVSKYITLNSNR